MLVEKPLISKFIMMSIILFFIWALAKNFTTTAYASTSGFITKYSSIEEVILNYGNFTEPIDKPYVLVMNAGGSESINVYQSISPFYVVFEGGYYKFTNDSEFNKFKVNKNGYVSLEYVYTPNYKINIFLSDPDKPNTANILVYINHDLYYGNEVWVDKSTPHEPEYDNYLIYAPIKNTNGEIIEDLNVRFIYKTSAGSNYFMGAAYDFFNAYLDDDRPEYVNIVNVNSKIFEAYWDSNDLCWKLTSETNGIRVNKDLLLASTHEILYENSDTFYPANPSGVIAPEGVEVIDPSIQPGYNPNGVPSVKGLKVIKENKNYKVSWDHVFGDFYVEIRFRFSNSYMGTENIFDITELPHLITRHGQVMVMDFRDKYLADLGTATISQAKLNDAIYDSDFEIGGEGLVPHVYGVDVRLVGKQNNKYYYGYWACCDLTIDPWGMDIGKNVVTYQDDQGNLVSEETVENIINENAKDQHYYGQLDLLYGKGIEDISLGDAWEVTNDAITTVGKIPGLISKLMTFMPTDIWSLIFFGISIVIILRVLGR